MKTRKIKPALIIYERLGCIVMRRRVPRIKDANSFNQQLYRRRNVVMWQAYNTIKAQLPADILQRCKQKGIDMTQRLKVEITRQCLTPNTNQTDWVAESVKILFDKFLMPYNGAFLTVLRLQWSPIASSVLQKNPSFLWPTTIINKIQTAS